MEKAGDEEETASWEWVRMNKARSAQEASTLALYTRVADFLLNFGWNASGGSSSTLLRSAS